MAVEDAPEMAWILDARIHSMEQIIEEEQAHRVQVDTLSQMQLQAMEYSVGGKVSLHCSGKGAVET